MPTLSDEEFFQKYGWRRGAENRLRRFGWVPFIRLNNKTVWVGPNGELETTLGAAILTTAPELRSRRPSYKKLFKSA